MVGTWLTLITHLSSIWLFKMKLQKEIQLMEQCYCRLPSQRPNHPIDIAKSVDSVPLPNFNQVVWLVTQFFQHCLLKRLFFPPCIFLGTFVENQLITHVWVYFWALLRYTQNILRYTQIYSEYYLFLGSTQFHWSICLFFVFCFFF